MVCIVLFRIILCVCFAHVTLNMDIYIQIWYPHIFMLVLSVTLLLCTSVIDNVGCSLQMFYFPVQLHVSVIHVIRIAKLIFLIKQSLLHPECHECESCSGTTQFNCMFGTFIDLKVENGMGWEGNVKAVYCLFVLKTRLFIVISSHVETLSHCFCVSYRFLHGHKIKAILFLLKLIS